jgi:hypothetical protein
MLQGAAVARGWLAKDPVGLNRPHGGGAMGIESEPTCPSPRDVRHEWCQVDPDLSANGSHVCNGSAMRVRRLIFTGHWRKRTKGQLSLRVTPRKVLAPTV